MPSQAADDFVTAAYRKISSDAEKLRDLVHDVQAHMITEIIPGVTAVRLVNDRPLPDAMPCFRLEPAGYSSVLASPTGLRGRLKGTYPRSRIAQRDEQRHDDHDSSDGVEISAGAAIGEIDDDEITTFADQSKKKKKKAKKTKKKGKTTVSLTDSVSVLSQDSLTEPVEDSTDQQVELSLSGLGPASDRMSTAWPTQSAKEEGEEEADARCKERTVGVQLHPSEISLLPMVGDDGLPQLQGIMGVFHTEDDHAIPSPTGGHHTPTSIVPPVTGEDDALEEENDTDHSVSSGGGIQEEESHVEHFPIAHTLYGRIVISPTPPDSPPAGDVQLIATTSAVIKVLEPSQDARPLTPPPEPPVGPVENSANIPFIVISPITTSLLSGTHPLTDNWTMHFSDTASASRSRQQRTATSLGVSSTSIDYSSHLITVFTAGCLEDFFGAWKALRRAIAYSKGRIIEPQGDNVLRGGAGLGTHWFPEDSNFHLFLGGVKPMWEDPMCQGGGKIMVAGDAPAMDNIFFEITLLLISGEIQAACPSPHVGITQVDSSSSFTESNMQNRILGAVISRRRITRIEIWLGGESSPSLEWVGQVHRFLMGKFPNLKVYGYKAFSKG
ncbi:hypothetical protein IAU60_002395 [Kwoniella sp. DSM 27419]